MFVDPVCGMKISNEEKASDKLDHKGRTYYFCTTLCRITFENEPEKFIKDNEHGINPKTQNSYSEE